MMLPISLPLFRLFHRMVGARPDRGALIVLLIFGYLAAWIGFGIAAHLLDTALHRLVAGWGWLIANGWLLGALVLAVAGLFQFSRLKYRCLDKCRTPYSFLSVHGAGPRRGVAAFASVLNTASSASAAAGQSCC